MGNVILNSCNFCNTYFFFCGFFGFLLLKEMENYLNENFGEVKAKNSSEEALQRWRKLCWIVKNRKRRFRFTANLSKRFEARAIQRSNQVSLSEPPPEFLFSVGPREKNMEI